MGIIRAAAGAVGGTLADSWLEYITAGEMGAEYRYDKGRSGHSQQTWQQ